MHISELGPVWVMQLTDKKMYYDRATTHRHFMKEDWVIYWHKPTAMQTLSNGWTSPFVVTEKVSVVDYRIQLNPTGPSKVVHVDQLRANVGKIRVKD